METLPSLADVKEMSIDDAALHLHNLAHQFFAPALIAEAAKVALDAIHTHEAMQEAMSALYTEYNTLQAAIAALQADRDTIKKEVIDLLKQREAVQTYLSNAAANILAQVKGT